MRLWHLGVLDSWSDIPRAQDPPYELVEGPDPVRVLLLGGSAVAGFGVATHQLGLVGCIGRRLAQATGRGVEVEACADVGMTLHELVERLQNLPRIRSGLVLVMLGRNDTRRLTTLGAWRRNLNNLFEVIRSDTVDNVQIIMVEAPVRRHAPLPERIFNWQARLLNETTRRVCRELDHVRLVPFPSSSEVTEPGLLIGSAEIYRKWAAELVAALEEALDRSRTRRPDTRPRISRSKRPLKDRRRHTAEPDPADLERLSNSEE